MRLLTFHNGEFSFTKDVIDNIPPYAILSHTWGADDEEVNFKDLTECTGKNKAGYKKLTFCRDQAIRDSLQHFWIDTCCIDKSNSTELSEAINSMYRWYRDSTKCYVYLSDISVTNHQLDLSAQPWESAFRQSRWFTRGWTLQELIAPRSVEFFCSNGQRLGNKQSLELKIHEITGIAVSALQGACLSTFPVHERLSWAESRKTKREEDKAYSLLGIFDIHMPLIYGEREENAFRRLHEEIKKSSRNHQYDELWTVSHAPSDSTKLENIMSNRSSPVPIHRDVPVLDQNDSSMKINHSRDVVTKEPCTNEPCTNESCIHKSCTLKSCINETFTRKPCTHRPCLYNSCTHEFCIKRSIIKQLYFAKIDERLTHLTAAQGITCRWFLTKPEFIAWHDLEQQSIHGGFLWIKGNPGTGKSTLMKFLFEEARLKANRKLLQITISFFFLARGTVEEKSTEGLYRSLLHQLFEKAEDLRDSLEWMTADGAKVIQRDGWREEMLKQTLKHAIQKLGTRSLTIFIDALDECDEKQTADMVSFFEELCDHGEVSRVRLQICFSSRYYPTIFIQKSTEVYLENEVGHTKDIENYLKSKLRMGLSEQANSLRSEILEKSCGIFLWVVLVVEILNFEYTHRSVSIKKIRDRLKEIPPKLTDLFEMILKRDGENLEQLQLCLKLLLFATRPLKPDELYFALQIGLDKECSGHWDQEDMDLDRIKTFVRSSSKGLAEVTRNNISEVQFIHESVRGFLLDERNCQWLGVSANFVGPCHEILKNCCLTQLNTSFGQYVKLPNLLTQASKAANLRKTISSKFPFVEYSIHNILYHSNCAHGNNINQKDFLASFPFQRWISWNNIFGKFDEERYTDSVSIPYILAEKNLVELIRIHPQSKSCLDIGSERYGPPIFAALTTGSHEAVQTFLEIQAKMLPENTSISDISRLYSQNRKTHFSFGRNFIFSKERGMVSYAAEMGQEEILILLRALGQLDANLKDMDGITPLMHAAGRGHEAVVRLLIEEGAELEARDEKTLQTPLSWAEIGGHEAVVKLLLDKGAKLEDLCFDTSLDMPQRSEGGGTRVVALLDERVKVGTVDKARKHRGPLTARGLYQQLRKQRYDDINSGQVLMEIPGKRGIATASDSNSDLEQEPQEQLKKYNLDPEEEIQPDAERTKIFITDLDRWSIIALTATASENQAPGLREAIYLHLKFRSFIGVTNPTSGLVMFQLAFHIPFYAWRTSDSAMAREDHRLNSKAKRLRNSQNVSFLNWKGSGSSDFLYEVQYSCLIAGTDETHWFAYGFFDTYFDDEAKETAEGYYSNGLDELSILADPLAFGKADLNKAIPSARGYWLCVLQHRISHVQHEWEQVVTKIEESISAYEETTHSRSYRLSKEDSLEGGKMDDEHTRVSRDWMVALRRLIKKLSQELARPVNAWEEFLRNHTIYFQNLSEVTDNGIRSLHAIQQVFDRLECLKQTLEDSADRCIVFTQELERQIILENDRLGDLQNKIGNEARKTSILMMISIPIALASGCLSINSGFISFIPLKFGLVAFLPLVFIFIILGVFIYVVLQYQNLCWKTVMALTGKEPWRKIFRLQQKELNESND